MTAAAVSSTALVSWVAAALLLGAVLGAAAATLVAGRSGRRGGAGTGGPGGTTAPVPGARQVREVDDLPGFLEHPPGSPDPPPAAVAGPAPATGATATRPARRSGAGRHSPDALSARRTLLAMASAAAVLVLVAAVIALVGGDDPAGDGTPASSPVPSPTPPEPTPLEPTPAEPAPTEVAAGALADRSVAPGDDGLTARASFGTVLLERRAVGVTVTRPDFDVSSDGERSLAHVRLPTFNCLVREPPADPESAGCARGATEYADLSSPGLRMTRAGDRLELAGRIATYTRPPAGPAAYTGRSYPIRATLTAEGPERDGRTPAGGVLRLGPDSAPTTDRPGANVLQLRG
ncbi:hypothetical protein [Modestobacter lapidis]|nr:hypothetical protein [Modestobacter lapidis]